MPRPQNTYFMWRNFWLLLLTTSNQHNIYSGQHCYGLCLIRSFLCFLACMCPQIHNRSVTVKRTHTTSSQPAHAVDDLLNSFHSKITNNRYYPNNVAGKQKAPWINYQKDDVGQKRKWCKSKLNIDLQIHKEMLRNYKHEISKSRHPCFSNIINRNVKNTVSYFLLLKS